MGIVAKLTKGTSYINLESGRYALAEDFVPPTTNVMPFLGSAGIKMGENALPRDWGFTVRVKGSSSAEVKRGVDDLANFLSLAGDEAQPLYFEWKEDNNVSAEPVWGQFGATRRLEITHGSVGYWDSYAVGKNTKDTIAFVPIFVTIKPWAQGARQLLAEAKGGIVEDWIGTTDGRSRGVQIPEADATNGNKFTNPMFGHGTWNNNWAAAGSLAAFKNTVKDFVVYGLNSAKLSSSSATNNTFTQSLNVGNTNTYILSCYVRLPDGGTVSATQCQLYYGSAQTTTYTAIGNGWYRLSCSVTGAAVGTATGILVKNNNTVYADAFQIEERAYITPYFYGDLPGCAWAGAAHDSKSYRNAAYLRLPIGNLLNLAEGTIALVWKADRANTTYAADGYLLYSNADFYLRFEDTGDVWEFHADGVTTSSAAATFATGDIIVLHITWEQGNIISIYLDGGVTGGPGPSYVKFNFGTYLYIGSNDTPAGHISGTFMGGILYDHAMTGTEVAADKANINALIADGQMVSSIPYIWTKDGDSVVDYIDSGAYENIAIIGGVPGDFPAKVEFKATVAGMSNADVYIGNLDVEYRKYLDPEFLSYIPASPPDVISLGTSDATLATISLDDDEFELIGGKQIAMMLRVDDDTSGNNVIIKTGINPGGAYYYSKQLTTIWAVTSTEVSIDLTPDQLIVPNEILYRELGITRALSVRAVGKRTGGSALDFKLHSAQIFPFPMIRLVNTSASGIAPTILYLDGRAYEVNSSALSYTYEVVGNKSKFSLLPGRYNLLVSYIGREAIATDSADTLTYNAIYITPRWAVL